MKKQILLIAALFLIAWATAQAQTQQGYVKTKGRMVNGQLVPGQGLKGATISIKGRTAVLVNAEDGAFSFPVTEKQFRLDSVKKKGYQIVDLDAVSRIYELSPNPLYLVMETPEQQLQDQLATERKIRRSLTRQLEAKEDEIESLKAANQLTEEEYRQQLQEIYAQQEANEKLIHEMAERYAQTDYDQLDELGRQISECIINGRLTEADSLLNTKGDLFQRIDDLRRSQEANAKEAEILAQRQAQLQAAQTGTQRILEDVAQDCHFKFETCKLRHDNDSAAYWIETRASLDTTNIYWTLEAIEFIKKYLADFPKAMEMVQTALARSIRQYGEWDDRTSECHRILGNTMATMADFDHALEHLNQAINILDHLYGPNHSATATCYNEIGLIYNDLSDYQNALEFYLKSMEIVEATNEGNPIPLIILNNNIGVVYNKLGNFAKACEYYQKAINIGTAIYGENDLNLSSVYNNLGQSLKNQSNYPQALQYFTKALSIFKENYGESHPNVATVYSNIASLYSNQGDFQQALDYQLQALEIKEKVFGEYHPECAISYANIGLTQAHLGDYDKAIEYDQKSIGILLDFIPENHPFISTINGNISSAYSSKKEYDKALEYRRKALDANIETYGENHPDVACDYDNLGNIYSRMGDGETALTYHNKALEIYTAIFGNSDNVDIAFVHDNLGFAYTVIGNYAKAMEHYEIALAMKTRLLGEDNYHTQRTKQSIEELKKKM